MPGIYAEKKESGFALPDPGTYVARCVSMIEIGTIPVDYGKGKGVEMHKKVSITFELPTELHVFDEEKGPQPFVVSKQYTLSMHKKAILRGDLESWRGQEYTEEQASKVDISKLLGQPCMLTIIQEASTKDSTKNYLKVRAIAKLMRGQTCPPQINPSKLLCYEQFDWNIFDELPDFLKNLIKSSEEFKQMQSPEMIHDSGSEENINDDNEPPF
jgi:hypothetical protein